MQQTTDILLIHVHFVFRCESSSTAMNIPRLNQMPGIMGNSLDEDDDYDSWKPWEAISGTVYFFLKEFSLVTARNKTRVWWHAVNVFIAMVLWQKSFNALTAFDAEVLQISLQWFNKLCIYLVKISGFLIWIGILYRLFLINR